MAKVYTIESIEGNSCLGVPVFSNFGKMQNYQYIVFSQPGGGGSDKKEPPAESDLKFKTNQNEIWNKDKKNLVNPESQKQKILQILESLNTQQKKT